MVWSLLSHQQLGVGGSMAMAWPHLVSEQPSDFTVCKPSIRIGSPLRVQRVRSASRASCCHPLLLLLVQYQTTFIRRLHMAEVDATRANLGQHFGALIRIHLAASIFGRGRLAILKIERLKEMSSTSDKSSL